MGQVTYSKKCQKCGETFSFTDDQIELVIGLSRRIAFSQLIG